MKFLSALAAGLFATTVTSLAIPDPEAVAEALPEPDPEAVPAAFASLTDVQIIKYTVKDWYADTAIVSKFLDNIAKKNFRSDAEFTKAAKVAWLAEYSSTAPTWGNKAVLDSYLAGKNGSNGSNGTEQGNGTWYVPSHAQSNVLYHVPSETNNRKTGPASNPTAKRSRTF